MVGLIVIAVGIPCKYVVQALFELCNDEGMPDLWLTWPWKKKLQQLLMGFKTHSWHWASPLTRPVWLLRFMQYRGGECPPLEVAFVLACPEHFEAGRNPLCVDEPRLHHAVLDRAAVARANWKLALARVVPQQLGGTPEQAAAAAAERRVWGAALRLALPTAPLDWPIFPSWREAAGPGSSAARVRWVRAAEAILRQSPQQRAALLERHRQAVRLGAGGPVVEGSASGRRLRASGRSRGSSEESCHNSVVTIPEPLGLPRQTAWADCGGPGPAAVAALPPRAPNLASATRGQAVLEHGLYALPEVEGGGGAGAAETACLPVTPHGQGAEPAEEGLPPPGRGRAGEHSEHGGHGGHGGHSAHGGEGGHGGEGEEHGHEHGGHDESDGSTGSDESESELEEEIEEAREEAQESARFARQLNQAAIGTCAAIWGVLAWIIFACARPAPRRLRASGRACLSCSAAPHAPTRLRALTDRPQTGS